MSDATVEHATTDSGCSVKVRRGTERGETDARRSGARRRIVVITYGAFSGIRDSVIQALRRLDCEVVEIPHSLRYLRLRLFYRALMVTNAVLLYGTKWRGYADRTWASQWARGRANQAAVKREGDIEAVISLAAMPTHTKRLQGVRYAIFTDHVNLLSKRATGLGVDVPEAHVHASWNAYERRIFAAQDHVFTLSRYVERCMVQDYGVARHKVAVVDAGPNLDVDYRRDGVVKDYSQKNVLFVGLEPIRKGLPTLLRAFEHVRRVFPDARLDVVGVQGQDEEGVRYHGRLSGDPLRQLFYRSQIFVMPSLREPFGIVFLEAMWAGAVCIGTDLAAMPEIIEDGATGFLIKPNDAVGLADRMVELFSQPDRLRAMADAGYRAAQARWTWDRSAQQMLDCLFPQDIAKSCAQAVVEQ